MSPVTHLFAGWLVGAKVTDNLRDCRLLTLCSILPDADGLPIILDLTNQFLGRPETQYYWTWHHYALHGIAGGVLIAAVLAAFAVRRTRVFLWSLLIFHLHLLCDYVGSRGPDITDKWPIFYLGPFTKDPIWVFPWQWSLDAWPNRMISVVLMVWILAWAVQKGHSVVGIFNRRLDAVVVAVLQKWYAAWKGRHSLP